MPGLSWLPRVLLFLLGEGKYNCQVQVPYFSLHFSDRNNSKKNELTWQGKQKSLSKKSLQQQRSTPEGKGSDAPAENDFLPGDRITSLRPPSMSQEGHISLVLHHTLSCPQS